MTIPNLTRDKIEAHTSGGSYKRGQEYFSNGAVRSLKRTGDNTLKAQVQGSDVHPYLVTIKFDENDIRKVQCTCPYHEGSWCKHIVAVLLKTLTADEVPLDETAEVSDLVHDLNRRDLITLLEQLVAQDPELLSDIRHETAQLRGT
jgi:uncharacterized Zn finger protein